MSGCRFFIYLFIYFLKKHVNIQIYSGEHKRGKTKTNYTE